MRRDLLTSVRAVLALTVLLGVLYPLLLTGISQLAFPGNANGQRVYVHGRLVGSRLIGQNFATALVGGNGKPRIRDGLLETTPDPAYFQSRPSATTPPDNAAATTFSNLGPNSRATLNEIRANIASYIRLNGPYYPGGLTATKVPVDAATSSASGIDPDISVANAEIQARRIAAVRHLPLAVVERLIHRYTGGLGLGFSGSVDVNVLELNLALDRISAR